MGFIPHHGFVQQPILGETAHVRGIAEYKELYRLSTEDAEGFWSEQARRYLAWEREWDFVLQYSSDEAIIEWFGGGLINASVNCLDRHAEQRGDTIAFHWEGDDPGETKSITYAELLESVTRLAGFLKHRGVEKGDTVFIYGASCIEVPTAMLACARIGAVHCIVSPAYSAAVLAERMKRCKAKALIAGDGYYHCGEAIPLGDKLDQAIGLYPGLIAVILISRLGGASVQPHRNACVW
ncbi:MAG: acetyl-CoA synthetase, partial [Thermodesulfobacteriota bacterium]|nr:acetyl-CoA synthetase [Thermodesulfobacteriota bacterium]